MKVFSSPASPFGRKVAITAHMKGLADRVDIQAMKADADENSNPLTKIPVLITDDGAEILTQYDLNVP